MVVVVGGLGGGRLEEKHQFGESCKPCSLHVSLFGGYFQAFLTFHGHTERGVGQVQIH